MEDTLIVGGVPTYSSQIPNTFELPELSQDYLKVVDGYKIMDRLGEGTFGKVKLAVHRLTGLRVAIKIVSKLSSDVRLMKREAAIQSRLKHENIIQLTQMTEDAKYCYMILEYASGGELFDKITPDVGVTEDVAQFYFVQLCNAIEFMHSSGIAHRDLKPENMLLDQFGNLKLTDFGLSTCFIFANQKRMLITPCGTKPYVAPEVITAGEYDGEFADLWSIGIILYTLFVGNTPWDEPTTVANEFVIYYNNRKQSDINFDQWARIPVIAKALIRSLLNLTPERRIKFHEIRKHPWYKRENTFMVNGRCTNTKLLAKDLARFDESHKTKIEHETKIEEELDCMGITSLTQPEIAKQPMLDYTQDDDDDDDYGARKAQSLPNQNFDMFECELGSLRDDMKELLPSTVLTKFYSNLARKPVMYQLEEILNYLVIINKLDVKGKKIFFSASDKRKCLLRGTITLNKVKSRSEITLTLVNFIKTQGDPMEFKRLFNYMAEKMKDSIVLNEVQVWKYMVNPENTPPSQIM